MKSKTKYLLTEADIENVFSSLHIYGLKSASPLGLGMFNAVYNVVADKEYVLKIAPKSDIPVMTYEKDMLKTELYWYDVIKKNTDISVPKIYGSDFSHSAVDADWFVMEKMDGVHRNKFSAPDCDNLLETVSIVSKLHGIKGDRYGYVQNGLYDTWADAVTAMITNLLSDAERFGKNSRRGQRFLGYAEKYRDILSSAPCVAVNYDLWDANIICKNTADGDPLFSIIDPERSMWGDPVFDFICLEGFTAPLEKKSKSVEYYNRLSDVKIEINRETKIRYAFAQGLMALIQETERYYRFRPVDKGWIIDTLSANVMYKSAFKVLSDE